MKSKHDYKKLLPHIIIGVLLLVVLIIFGVFDLAIVTSFETNKNWFTIGFDVWGMHVVWIPVGVTVIFASIMIAHKFFKNYYNTLWGSLIGFGITIVGLIIFEAIKYKSFEQHSVESKINLISIIVVLIITVLSLIATVVLVNVSIIFQREEYLSSLLMRVIYSLLLLIITSIIIWLFKIIWGRPRPNAVLDDFELFKYLFQINFGSNRGRSFPSGHAQAAGMILALIYFVPNLKSRKITITILSLVAAISIVLTSLSRVLYHKHFPSDVMFATILVIACFVYIPKIMKLIIKK